MSFGRLASDSSETPLFINVKYEFHKTLSLSKRRELEEKLNRNGAVKIDHETGEGGKPTHIITTRYFEHDIDGSRTAPFVVTPLWVESAIKNEFVHDPKYYSPNPEKLFSGMVATAPTLPPNDKIAICAGMSHLGGQYRDTLTKDTTHLVAISETGRTYERAMARKLTIVLPHYFDDCLKMRRLLRVDNYSFPDPPLMDPNTKVKREENNMPESKDDKQSYEALRDLIYPPYGSMFGKERYQIEMKAPVEPYLDGECIYVEPGVVSRKDEGVLVSWLEYLKSAAGATIATEYDKEHVTIVIAVDRSTSTYIQASQDGKLVASKWWLTNTISRRAKELPIATLVDYPMPRGGIPGTKGVRVTVSGYRGTARDYLRRIAIHCGMRYSSDLTAETTYLICSSQNLLKFSRAKAMNITTVNHIWLEESFRQWKLLSPADERFIHFPSGEIIRLLVGNTSLDPKILKQWWEDPAKRPEEVPLLKENWEIQVPPELQRVGKINPPRKAAEDAATTLQEVYVPDMNAYQKEKRGKRVQPLQTIPEGTGERGLKKQKSNSNEESDQQSETIPEQPKSPSPPALEQSASSSNAHRIEKKSPPKRSERKGKEKAIQALKATSAAVSFIEKPKVLFTAMSVTKDMESKLKRLGGSRVDFVDKATHLVVEDRVLRTPKFLCAVNLGINIVTRQWLNDSFDASQWQDPQQYIPKDEKNTSFDLEASLSLAREMRETEGSRRHPTGTWLSGFNVCFLQNEDAKAKGMYDIVNTAGGKVIQRISAAGISTSLIVLSFPEKKDRWEGLKDSGIPIYDTELIITGSLRQRLDLERFRLG